MGSGYCVASIPRQYRCPPPSPTTGTLGPCHSTNCDAQTAKHQQCQGAQIVLDITHPWKGIGFTG